MNSKDLSDIQDLLNQRVVMQKLIQICHSDKITITNFETEPYPGYVIIADNNIKGAIRELCVAKIATINYHLEKDYNYKDEG